MKGKLILLAVLLLALGACTAEPETIVETVIQEATVEVPQTVEVEVTRQVEVTVEVTREVEVEVTKEVPVEVTRIVEVMVTATPEPTSEPTPTNTPEPIQATEPATEPAAAPAAEPSPEPASDLVSSLLQASYTLRDSINGFRDGLAGGNCHEVVKHQDVFLASPRFDVSAAPSEVQWAYGHYLASLDLAKDAALGIGDGCRNAIETQTRFTITGLNYQDIRSKLERAMSELNDAVNILESLGP